jgi:hypothetical protein
MLAIHWRLAELTTINKNRSLTDDELSEVSMCLEANANYAFKLSKLYNLSGIASMMDDEDWLNEICIDIDKLEIQYKLQK